MKFNSDIARHMYKKVYTAPYSSYVRKADCEMYQQQQNCKRCPNVANAFMSH